MLEDLKRLRAKLFYYGGAAVVAMAVVLVLTTILSGDMSLSGAGISLAAASTGVLLHIVGRVLLSR